MGLLTKNKFIMEQVYNGFVMKNAYLTMNVKVKNVDIYEGKIINV